MSVLVIRDVRVFDGVSERAIETGSVVVEGARIREVVQGAVTPPRDARVIEGRGGTLLPGLVDMHSHLVSPLGARLYLANGVTTVRFAGNDPDAVLALREAVEAARIPGPRVFSLGPLLDGVSPDYPAMSWPLCSAAEARLAVQRLKADYRVDGIILTQKPALEVARAAVDEAHRLGIGVTGQTWSLTAREAVALGYDGLENTSRLPESPGALPETALLRYRTIPERSAMLALLWARADPGRLERLGHQMLKYETYLVPTLAGMDAILGRYTARIRRDGDTRRLPATARRDLLGWLGQRFFGAAWTPRDFANWARGRTRYHAFVRDYARLGGRVLVGTDALKPCAGLLFHEELHRLRACGLSSAAVLRAATAAAADTLGRPDLGRIAPGAQADLVLVAGNPLRRLADARAVRAVVVRGRLLEPDPVFPHPRTRTA
jgi:cytosine/adenosine deaminase-related metal-dependent hydrolase